ncbi:LPS-assembly lipoprotein LptE [Facilibium subflavum]|uniref:LPS-assembly lipoprotein LptE n=1 Tax=Facilibium subflavum TaxID=2219058 RepID=UPI0013C32005|nr:LPS assembly lipoprotein LptE [Facilibium subflavum]
MFLKKTAYTKHYIRLTLIMLFAGLLYGCGFHLRGFNQELPKFMQKIYIEYDGNDFSFLNTLHATLNATGATLTTQQKQANIILEIRQAASSQRLVGITGGASSNQYLISYTVDYQLLTSDGQVILANQSNTASQSFNTNATQQLSNDTQKQEIIANLQTQVANNIISQMQSISEQDYQNALASDSEN